MKDSMTLDRARRVLAKLTCSCGTARVRCAVSRHFMVCPTCDSRLVQVRALHVLQARAVMVDALPKAFPVSRGKFTLADAVKFWGFVGDGRRRAEPGDSCGDGEVIAMIVTKSMRRVRKLRRLTPKGNP
jgi:hypothetical protein